MTRLMQLGAPCRITGLVAYLPRDLSYFTESNCRGRPAILLNHSPVVAAKAMHYDLKMLVAAIAPSLRISGPSYAVACRCVDEVYNPTTCIGENFRQRC